MSKERSPRKTFTAEIQLRNRYGSGEASPDVVSGNVVASDPEVREEIEALKNEVSHLSHMLRTYVIPPEDEQKAADGESEDSEDPLVKEFQKQRDEVRVKDGAARLVQLYPRNQARDCPSADLRRRG